MRVLRLSSFALALMLLVSACAHRSPRQRAAAALTAVGAVAVGAGLLVAGECNRRESRRDGRSEGCTGTPDREDAARGMAIVAAGVATMAAAAAVAPREGSSRSTKSDPEDATDEGLLLRVRAPWTPTSLQGVPLRDP